MQMEILLLFLFLSWRSPSHRRCRRGRGNHKVLAIKEIKRLTPRDREGGREGWDGGPQTLVAQRIQGEEEEGITRSQRYKKEHCRKR